MNKRNLAFVTVVAVLPLFFSSEAFAQLFGPRTLGQPLSRRSRPGMRAQSLEDVGTLSGNERFLRSNRSRSDFVGVDIRDHVGFVGAVQANKTTRVVSPTAGLRVEIGTTSPVNQPRGGPSQSGLYEPRLQLGFNVPLLGTKAADPRVAAKLQSLEALKRLGRIEVSVEGQTATLRGVVPSAHAARLATLLALFEPGIESVRNELQIGTVASPQSSGKTQQQSKQSKQPLPPQNRSQEDRSPK